MAVTFVFIAGIGPTPLHGFGFDFRTWRSEKATSPIFNRAGQFQPCTASHRDQRRAGDAGRAGKFCWVEALARCDVVDIATRRAARENAFVAQSADLSNQPLRGGDKGQTVRGQTPRRSRWWTNPIDCPRDSAFTL
jgi:hypothetical protein